MRRTPLPCSRSPREGKPGPGSGLREGACAQKMKEVSLRLPAGPPETVQLALYWTQPSGLENDFRELPEGAIPCPIKFSCRTSASPPARMRKPATGNRAGQGSDVRASYFERSMSQ